MRPAISEAVAPFCPPKLLIRISPRSRFPTFTMPGIRTSNFTSFKTNESIRYFFDFVSLAPSGRADRSFTCASNAVMLFFFPLPSKRIATFSICTVLIRMTEPVTEPISSVTFPVPTERRSSRLKPFGLPMRKSLINPSACVNSIRKLPKRTDTPVASSTALTTAFRTSQSLPL